MDSRFRQLQLTELEMLEYFDSICKKHNIKYYLVAGTALGAIRHKGFIPWDDDIDVGILRKDYKRFLKVAAMEFDERFFLQTYKTDAQYHLPYAKLRRNDTLFVEPDITDLHMHHGIFIDIFCLYSVPSNKFLQKLHGGVLHFTKLIHAAFKRLKLFKFDRLVLSFMDKLAAIFPEKLCKCRSIVFSLSPYDEEAVPADVFSGTVLHEFEGKMYPLPENWDRYLKHLFGDYMTPPPENKRIPHATKFILTNEKADSYNAK